MAYLTLAEAKAWIAAHVRTSDLAGWTALEDADKQIALQEAEDKIDALPLRGRRYEDKHIENGIQKDVDNDGIAQVNEFPRHIDGVICDWDHGADLPIVPQAVKDAVCLEAVALCQGGSRRRLQQEGVQSFSIGGKLSETFREGAGSEMLLSNKARLIMRKYVGAELR